MFKVYYRETLSTKAFSSQQQGSSRASTVLPERSDTTYPAQQTIIDLIYNLNRSFNASTVLPEPSDTAYPTQQTLIDLIYDLNRSFNAEGLNKSYAKFGVKLKLTNIN